MMMERILEAWGIELAGVDSAAHIEGSPERTAARSVVRDSSGQRWVLEQIDPENLARKQQIAEHLHALHASGLRRVHPWRRTSDAQFFQAVENNRISAQGAAAARWMVRPYVEGIPLDRETYLHESWRIDALAEFLLEFRSHSAPLQTPRFSMPAYAEDRMRVWRGRYPALTPKLEGSFAKLKQRFFPQHDHLPVAFCHGDYHPLNVVWGSDSIASVIDWEFCGTKPELYDVALLLGCIGFDEPDNLLKEPAIHLIQTLRAAGFGAEQSWAQLPDLMAVIRYGWMSEWIRRQDEEAAAMECVYIDILVDQKDYIQRAWKQGS